MRYLAILLVLFALPVRGQVVDAVDVRIKMKEKRAGQIVAMPNANLTITDLGSATTNEAGEYRFTYPIRNNVEPIISIGLESPDHKMLRPVDGDIQLDTTVAEMQIEFLVVNLDAETPALKKRIASLEKRMQSMKRKNTLTLQQLNALNETLLDTIMHYEANRLMLENQVAEYQSENEDQAEEIAQLRQEVFNLESQVDDLTIQLENALEERFLRQNEHFRELSSNLLMYLRKAKDIRDHLPFIMNYFNSSAGFQNFDQDIRGYNKAYETFDELQPNYLVGINQYWENPTLTKKIEEVFSFLGKGIHQGQILPVVNGINQELHKQKPRRAQKLADASHEDMAINLRALEKQINRALVLLRKNI